MNYTELLAPLNKLIEVYNYEDLDIVEQRIISKEVFEGEIQWDLEAIHALNAYEDLKCRLRWLRALEAAGVDNWEGYENAVESYGEDE